MRLLTRGLTALGVPWVIVGFIPHGHDIFGFAVTLLSQDVIDVDMDAMPTTDYTTIILFISLRSLETSPSQNWKIPIMLQKVLPDHKHTCLTKTNYKFSLSLIVSFTFGS